MNEQTAVVNKQSELKIDSPVIAFFVIAYAIAWGLVLVFDAIAAASGVENGLTLMVMAESLELAPIADQLIVPGWFCIY